MNPERWPGEPLHDRLTIAEREEVQACLVRQWRGRKRREQFDRERALVQRVTAGPPALPPPLSGDQAAHIRRVTAGLRGKPRRTGSPQGRPTMTLPHAAALVGVSARTMTRWVQTGVVESIRTAGGTVLIYADTLWRDERGTPPAGRP